MTHDKGSGKRSEEKGLEFRIAVVATAFTPRSHAHVITERWVAPLPTDADYEWTGPRTRLASLYLMQKGPEDQSRPLIETHGVRDSPTVRDALTLGTGELAVDAVMIIGEHGDFPYNELGQKLYPRKELFDQVMDVIEASGRQIPLYFDKHYSWNPDYALEMASRVERAGLPFFGGSCTPHCSMSPERPNLAGRKIHGALITCWGELEGYLFHALETLGSVVEMRAGGESGLESIRAWRDAESWQAVDAGHLPMDLLDAALEVLPTEVQAAARLRLSERTEPIELFELRYCDGMVATIVRLQGSIRRWAVACEVEGEAEPVAASPIAGSKELFHPHFARLARRIEDFFLTRTSPIPTSRLMFSTLACAACMQALNRNGSPVTEKLP